METGTTPGLSPALAGFLDDESRSDDGTALAASELYVEEELLGKATSRFVREGGVQLIRVDSYMITPEDLPAAALRRRRIDQVQLELAKFRFMIDPLPPSRHYTSVSVRVTLRPPAQAFMLRPKLEMTETDTERTSTSEFTPHLARLLQLHMSQTSGRTDRRTESAPVVTAINHGLNGFGWTFEAREGAPLHPREEITMAMLELAPATSTLRGLFDAEALISRRVLGTLASRRAAPVNSAAEFDVRLVAG